MASLLCEGGNIRTAERIAVIHCDTIMQFDVHTGAGCSRITDDGPRNLPCQGMRVDEVWEFVGMKQETALRDHGNDAVGLC